MEEKKNNKENGSENPVKEEKKEQEQGQSDNNNKSPEQLAAELNDKYLRLYSEFENYKRRTVKERAEFAKYAGEEIFSGLLPVLDDFDRALKSLEGDKEAKSASEGMKLIHHKLANFLKQRGVQEIQTEGQEFNTDLHEAITNVPVQDEKMKGKVVECVEKGYTLHGKVIRYAKVVVGS